MNGTEQDRVDWKISKPRPVDSDGRTPIERLVAFSCKGRGFCPRYGGQRMAERAAHLVDHVLPDIPVRQWVTPP
jgi:hypothetical protein